MERERGKIKNCRAKQRQGQSKRMKGVAQHSVSILASHPAALGSIPSVPKIFMRKIIDVAEVNQWHWLEERGQQLENVDGTHQVLASGKPELKKENEHKQRENKSRRRKSLNHS